MAYDGNETIWLWRNRYYDVAWKIYGDGSKPDIWWLQQEYREVARKDLKSLGRGHYGLR